MLSRQDQHMAAYIAERLHEFGVVQLAVLKTCNMFAFDNICIQRRKLLHFRESNNKQIMQNSDGNTSNLF